MAQDIHTTLHVTVKEGKIKEFTRLVEEMSKAVEDNEPGAIRYQFFLNKDETQCILNESYVNIEAVLAHLKGAAVQIILPKILNICKIDRFEVFGDVTDELLKTLSKVGGVNYHFLNGFSR
jgi:quinol monooxygenase YgiN